MATNEGILVTGETTTEAYKDLFEARSRACAADYWAGPGIKRPVPVSYVESKLIPEVS